MGKPILEPRTIIHFKCGCGHAFESPPSRTVDEPDRPWHPFRYFAKCPACSEEAEQIHWEKAMLKACTMATGPRTKEGKAISSMNGFKNTGQNSGLSRFNALKHGMDAKVATFFPARPGKYPQCDGCEIFDSCKMNVACMKKTELFMRHQVAFEMGDPSMLTSLRASLQANIQAVIDDMFLAIIQDGVRIKKPMWYYDKDGTFRWAEGIDSQSGEMVKMYEIQAHPLIKLVGDLIAKNGMTLADSAMTQRQAGLSDTPEADATAPTGEELREWKARSERQQEQLMAMIKRSQNVIDVTPEAEE